MTRNTKSLIRAVAGIIFSWVCVGCIAIPVILMLFGCAAGATSEITPAKAAASDKSLDVTAPVKRRWRFAVIPQSHATAFEPVLPIGPDEGEDK